jgi:CRISPR-associated helicase, Cas3 family
MKEQEYSQNYYKYWGKAKNSDPKEPNYHLLVYHSLDVAACGWLLLSGDYPWVRQLARSLKICPEQLRRLFVFFLCLHDIGGIL